MHYSLIIHVGINQFRNCQVTCDSINSLDNRISEVEYINM